MNDITTIGPDTAKGVVTSSQIERNSPITANAEA
jgi:hypothetical protein